MLNLTRILFKRIDSGDVASFAVVGIGVNISVLLHRNATDNRSAFEIRHAMVLLNHVIDNVLPSKTSEN